MELQILIETIHSVTEIRRSLIRWGFCPGPSKSVQYGILKYINFKLAKHQKCLIITMFEDFSSKAFSFIAFSLKIFFS